MSQYLVNNRYYLDRRLGQGGFSEVFKAIDVYSQHYGDNRSLAIKLPLDYLVSKDDIDAFFYNEFSCLAKISHPNIIKVFDFGIDTNRNLPYIILEHIEGQLLSEIPYRRLKIAEKTAIMDALIDCVKYLHQNNIIHSDINPNNIMVLKNGSIKLFDFGISINTAQHYPFQLNYNTLKAFNPKYAAPEILKGSIPTPQSDIFSLGVVCFQLFKDMMPYTNNSSELEKKKLNFFDMLHIPLGYKKWIQKSISHNQYRRPKF